MSIRFRLVLMCLVISLLPAIPLTILVQSLIEKSFNVGLNEDVEEALQSGLVISRERLEQLRRSFEEEVENVVSGLSLSSLDSSSVLAALSRNTDSPREIDGFIIGMLSPDTQRNVRVLRTSKNQQEKGSALLPEELEVFSNNPAFIQLMAGANAIHQRPHAAPRPGLIFFERGDRSVQLALWKPKKDKEKLEAQIFPDRLLLLYKKTDPNFLAQANKVLVGRQTFAQLRLAQRQLNRSFFYPFIFIYSVILLLSLCLALLMAERLANPIRRLVSGTNVVAGGDWSYRLKTKTGGELGRLVNAFNGMVARLEEQKRRLIDMEKMAAWREMARRLAHEIKNPLLPIRLTIQELKDQYKGDDSTYNKLLSESTRVVGDELNSLQKLVKEFSSFARMPDLSPKTGSIESLVRDVATLYPQVETEISSGFGLVEFPFDHDSMRRVFINLFDNSITALGDNKDGKIKITMDGNGDFAEINFSDNGSGISSDILPKIFDPYFTSSSGGTGLGLAMVKNIILLHGGSINVKSTEGKGTVFTMFIPVAGPGGGPPGN